MCSRRVTAAFLSEQREFPHSANEAGLAPGRRQLLFATVQYADGRWWAAQQRGSFCKDEEAACLAGGQGGGWDVSSAMLPGLLRTAAHLGGIQTTRRTQSWPRRNERRFLRLQECFLLRHSRTPRPAKPVPNNTRVRGSGAEPVGSPIGSLAGGGSFPPGAVYPNPSSDSCWPSDCVLCESDVSDVPPPPECDPHGNLMACAPRAQRMLTITTVTTISRKCLLGIFFSFPGAVFLDNRPFIHRFLRGSAYLLKTSTLFHIASLPPRRLGRPLL